MTDAIPKGPEGVSAGAWDDLVRRLEIVAGGSRTGSAWFTPEEARHTLAALRAYEPPKPPPEPEFEDDPIGWLRWKEGKGAAVLGSESVGKLIAAIDALAKPAEPEPEPTTPEFVHEDSTGDKLTFYHPFGSDRAAAYIDEDGDMVYVKLAEADQFIADLAAFFAKAKARHAKA